MNKAVQSVFDCCDLRTEILKHKTTMFHKVKDAAIIIFRNLLRFYAKQNLRHILGPWVYNTLIRWGAFNDEIFSKIGWYQLARWSLKDYVAYRRKIFWSTNSHLAFVWEHI